MEQNTLKRRLLGVTGCNTSKTSGGFTLFAPVYSNKAYLIDITGKPAHEWTLPSRVGRHVRLLSNGNLAANTIIESDDQPFLFFHKYGGGLMTQLSPSGNVLSQFHDRYGHHDQYHYGDGRLLYASIEPLPRDLNHQVLGGVPGTEAPGGIVYTDIIREVDAQGTLTWEWSVKDNLPFSEYLLQAHYPREHYPLINGLHPMKDGKHILVSLRSVSWLIVVERSSGAIVWKLGPDVLAQQHFAS